MADTMKKRFRKAGRTLLIKPVESKETKFESHVKTLLENQKFEGIVSVSDSAKGAKFLLFDTISNAITAFKVFRNDELVFVKYAHYRIFFNMTGLTTLDKVDYNQVKETHSTWVTDKTQSNVLYYKLYRNGDKYLGCGEMTVDTKEGVDHLLQKDSLLKEYTINVDNATLGGKYFQYNRTKKDDSKEEEEEQQ